jgi:hypothetical protein
MLKMTSNRQVCPHCATSVFPWRGPSNAKIAVLMDEPSMADKEKMTAFSGPAGWVLRNEMDRASIDLFSCRRGYFFYHTMPVGKEGEACRTTSIEEAIRELNNNRQAVLLLGSKCVKYFTNGIGVDTVSSLPISSPYIHCNNIMAGISPLNVLSGTVGELRLTCFRFNQMLNDIDEQRRQSFIKAYDVKE